MAARGSGRLQHSELRGPGVIEAAPGPPQLEEPDWHSIGDVDPALAARTRERLWRELEDDRTLGVGAHFPELRFGRVLAGRGRRWVT